MHICMYIIVEDACACVLHVQNNIMNFESGRSFICFADFGQNMEVFIFPKVSYHFLETRDKKTISTTTGC